MNIYVEKIALAKRVLDTDDEQILLRIKDLLNGVEDDWWSDLDEEGKTSVEKGITQSKNNELLDHDYVMKNSL